MNFYQKHFRQVRWPRRFVCAFVISMLAPLTMIHGQIFYPDNPIDMEQLQGPFIDEDPFDLIYLDDFNKNAILKILPLEVKPEKPYPDRTSLKFDLVNDNEYTYQVPYNRIVEYKTYNDLLLEEANRLLAKKDFAKAFRNLLYIYDHGGKQNPAIQQSLQQCLYQDATTNFTTGKFELALSIYEDMFRVDPKFKVPGLNYTLPEIIMRCYEGILRERFKNGEYHEARLLLAEIAKKYDKDDDELQDVWDRRFGQESDKLIAEARQMAAEGRGREAHLMARRVNTIFPGREQNTVLYDDIVKQFPYVFVGVQEGMGDADPNSIENWGARRVGRLIQRTLVEMNGLTDEGGQYDFVGGQIMPVDEDGLIYRFTLMENDGFATPPITAFDVSSRLLNLGNYQRDGYSIPFAKIIKDVSIESDTSVSFRLDFPFVRPEALLQIPFQDADENGNPVLNGAYTPTVVEGEYSSYDLNPMYSPVEGRQHPKIIERKFEYATDATEALIRGDIDVIDRIALADYRRLRSVPEIQVANYAVPTMHMLIPNQRNDFMKNVNFRMGLLRGINRQSILREMICGGEEINGCEVVSGPFPIGTDTNDQIAYGYNNQIIPMDHNSKLGMVFVQIAKRTMEDKLREAGTENPKVDIPVIVLAHPNNYAANVACTAIKKGWEELDVKVDLRRLEDGESVPADDNWDFLYVAASMQEPLADASKLMGERGFAKTVTAPIEQSLRMLSYSNSWQSACSTLRRVHRQISNDIVILPLWQLNEHYAYRINVRDIDRELIHLYQNVERWKIDSTYELKPEP